MILDGAFPRNALILSVPQQHTSFFTKDNYMQCFPLGWTAAGLACGANTFLKALLELPASALQCR